MKKIIAIIIIVVMMVLNIPQAEAASSRRMPTAYVIHTYGGATRTYQEGELTTWEELTDIDCTSVTTTDQDSSGTTLYVADTTVFEDCELNRSTVSCDGQILTITGVNAGASLTVSSISGTIASGTDVKAGFVLEGYTDSASYNDNVVISGATTDADFFRVLKAAAGHENNGTLGGFRFNLSNFAGVQVIITSGELYCGIYDICVTGTSNTEEYGRCAISNNSVNGIVTGCVVSYRKGTNGYQPNGFYNQGANAYMINCIAYECGANGFATWYGTTFYNCTSVHNTANGFRSYSGTSAEATAINCVSEDNTIANWAEDGGGTWSKTNCTDDDGVVFENAGSDNYHLDSTDADAINQGTDLSGDESFPFDDDIDGQTRGGTWDIGADEYGLLAAPTGVSATDGTYSDKVTVNWNAVGSATGYEVWRNTVDDSASASRIKDSNQSVSYDDTSASYGITYYYWVKTESAEGESAFSLSDSGYLAPPQPPPLVLSKGFVIRNGGSIVVRGGGE